MIEEKLPMSKLKISSTKAKEGDSPPISCGQKIGAKNAKKLGF